MKQAVTVIAPIQVAPIQGPGMMSLVKAYLHLTPTHGGDASTVTVSRGFEWRAEGLPRHIAPLLPVNRFRIYGNGVQRLSSGVAGVTKASPKK